MRKLFFTILVSSMLFAQAQSKVDSLLLKLAASRSDTGKISLFIALTHSSGEYLDKLHYARQAFNLGKQVSSIKHKSRSEITYGSYLAETKLDSGIFLIDRGKERYLKSELFDYAANALYVKGVTFEVTSMYDSAVSTYTILHRFASEKEIHPQWGDAAYALSYLNNRRGNNVDAIKWALEARKAYEAGGESKKIGQTFNEIGIIYDQQGLYSEALDNYLQALEYARINNHIEGEILTNNNIGVIYDNMNNSEMALRYYHDGLEKARIYGDKEDEATLLNNLSYIHLSNGDTLQGIQALRSSLEIDLSKLSPCFESYPLEGLGAIFIDQKKLDSANILLTRALELAQKCQDVVVQVVVFRGLGRISQMKGDISRASDFYGRSLELSKKAVLPIEIKKTLFALYRLHKSNDNVTKSLRYLEEYQHLSDSISRQKNVEKATQLAAEYEFRKQTAKIERERDLMQEEMNQEIEAKVLENRLLLWGALLVLVLSAVLVRAYVVIKKNNARLKYLNEEKNRLIGIVAHDLRNPLNMMKGILPLVEQSRESSTDPYFPKYLDILHSSSEKMTGLIERVLDISAIENMRLNLNIERTDLTHLTKQSINNFSAIAKQKAINIIDEIEKDKTHYSDVDANYLEQVIDNLISNAIKFSEKGKSVYVSVNAQDSDNIIEIRDEGPGIAEEEEKELFKAFATASPKPTGEERSTGLGLSIAMKFIKAMNGKIELDSQLGTGTTFKVVLASS